MVVKLGADHPAFNVGNGKLPRPFEEKVGGRGRTRGQFYPPSSQPSPPGGRRSNDVILDFNSTFGFKTQLGEKLHIRVLIKKDPRLSSRHHGIFDNRVEDSSGRQLFNGRWPEWQKSVAIIRSVDKVDLHLSPLDPWILESLNPESCILT